MKKFNIAISNNVLFGASITPGTIFGEYTQIFAHKKDAVKYVWLIRDYSHVPMRVEVLKRGAKSWRTYTLPDDSAGDALKGMFGKILRYIEKFEDRLPSDMRADICTRGSIGAPKERKVKALDKSIDVSRYSAYAFAPNYGQDACAYDTSIHPRARAEWDDRRDISNCNGQSRYISESTKYTREYEKCKYIMHDGSVYYYHE